MGKRISECCDQWNNLQTMALASKMDADTFKPTINNFSSLDEFENDIRDQIESNIDSCRSEFGELDPENTMQIFALAALNDVDVDQIVNTILNYYEPQVRILRIESRVNNLYKRFIESKQIKIERETTPAHDGESAAFDIKTNFDKDELDVDSEVDVKNKKDAWILRLVYNDGNKENLSMVKPDDDEDKYTITSDKDKLNASFEDDPEDGTLSVPQTVIDHIAKHIEQAEKNVEDSVEKDNTDLAKEIAYDIRKEFPNYDMEVIEGDNSGDKWTIEVVYKDGNKEQFVIKKIANTYLMRAGDTFIGKFSLKELKDFPKKLQQHISDKVEEK